MSYDVKQLPFLKRQWMMHTSNIPHRFLGLSPEDVEQDLGKFAPEINEWIDQVLKGKVIQDVGGLGVNGVGLLFDGPAGLGKTTHSVVCLMELVRRLPDEPDKMRSLLKLHHEDLGPATRFVYYMTVPDFIARKKSIIEAEPAEKRELQLQMDGFHGKSKMDHLNVRVLVLDDLGKEATSEYNVAGFDELLRTRYDKGLPTIVTTNLERSQWKTKYGTAMGSFVYEAFNRVIIEGKDLRRNK